MRQSHPWLVSNGRRAEASAVSDVLEFRRAATSAAYWIPMDLDNIEELFSLASAYPNKIGRSLRLAIAATLDFSRSTEIEAPIHIELSTENGRKVLGPWCKPIPPPSLPGHLNISCYRMWLARILGMMTDGHPIGRNTFITFNYDTVLEDTLDGLGVPFSYGFSHQEVSIVGKGRGVEEKSGIKVLKIHGSVNWARSKVTNSTRVFDSYAALRTAQLSPQLIPPSWRKSYLNLFSSIMDKAVAELSTATRIIVVGFSMPQTDVHFKYMLAAGLSANISLQRMWFVTPSAADLQVRVQSQFKDQYVSNGRISFVSQTFGSMAMDWNMLSAIERPHPKDNSYCIYS